MTKNVYFFRFQNFGNLLSPSLQIFNIFERQWRQKNILSDNINMKDIISMRFSALSFYGIKSFILYRESTQETLKIRDYPNLDAVLKNTVNKLGLSIFIAGYQEINAYR